jgi:hypothetical protein
MSPFMAAYSRWPLSGSLGLCHAIPAPLRLDERFHETYRFHALSPHPEEQAFARGAEARVSKDGSLHDLRLWPSFEMRRLRDAPQDEVREDADTTRTSETQY